MADLPAFDGNAYRKEVLKRLLDATELPDDPFLLVGLPAEVDDDAAIRAHLDRVVGFWRKEEQSPRYGSLVTTLLGRREQLAATLLDPGSRAAARQRTAAAADVAAAERFTRLDAVLDQLVDRFGGVPSSRIPRLREVFGDELGPAAVDARIADRTVIDDATPQGPALPDAVRRRVRALLVELTRLRSQADPTARPLRTLHDFLDLDPGVPPDQVEARRAAAEQRNRQRRHDRDRTVTDELLALATQLLVRGDPAAYAAALAEDAADVLAPAIETALLLDDGLSAPEFERLLREGVELGLTAVQARQTVVALAARAGAPIQTGAVVDYLTCTRCGAAQPLQPDHRACSRCHAPLYATCPRCRAEHPVSAHTCPSCGFDVAGLVGARADLVAAVRAIEEGRATAAVELLDGLGPWAAHLPELAGVRERLGEARAAEALADLRDLPEAEREAAVLVLLAEHPGAPALVAALREMGLAPATAVRATSTAAGVQVSWAASTSPGRVAYRVQREVRPFGGAPQRTALGRTALLAVEDAGAPPGVDVAYVVTAVREGIAAEDATSVPVVLAPVVADLRGIQRDGAVELAWSTPPGAADVWVEVADAAEPGTRLRRLRGGTSGLLDTAVQDGLTYRYAAVAEYRPAVGPTVRSDAVAVEVQAVALPDAPHLDVRTTTDRVLLQADLLGSARLVVTRSSAPPATPAGRVGDPPTATPDIPVLTPRRGVVADRLQGPPRWYQPFAVVGTTAIAGHPLAHPGLAPVTDLAARQDGDALVLTWTWPDGCTECRVLVGPQPPADGADPPADPGTTSRKVTNSRYQIDGGARVDGVGPGPRHVLVVPLGRSGGDAIPLPQPDRGSRLHHDLEVSGSVSES